MVYIYIYVQLIPHSTNPLEKAGVKSILVCAHILTQALDANSSRNKCKMEKQNIAIVSGILPIYIYSLLILCYKIQVGISLELPGPPSEERNLRFSTLHEYLLDKGESYTKIPNDRFNVDA